MTVVDKKKKGGGGRPEICKYFNCTRLTHRSANNNRRYLECLNLNLKKCLKTSLLMASIPIPYTKPSPLPSQYPL